MDFLKNYFKDKKYGFYVVLGTMLLSLITLIAYAVGFSYLGYLSGWAVALLAIGVVLAAVLIVFKQYKFVPAALLATIFLAFLLAVYFVYNFVISSLFWGNFSAPPQLIVPLVFFVLALVASIVGVFTPIVKQDKENVK